MSNPKKNTQTQALKVGITPPPRFPDALFWQWLNHVLADENGRAFIRSQLRQSELPVIQLAKRRRKASRSRRANN
jgi:hypothetical protein